MNCALVSPRLVRAVPQPAVGTAATITARSAPRTIRRSCGSHIRGPDVIADDGREEHRVETVQRTAVGAEKATGVLGFCLALDEGLEQVTQGCRQRDADAEHERVRGRQPVLIAP